MMARSWTKRHRMTIQEPLFRAVYRRSIYLSDQAVLEHTLLVRSIFAVVSLTSVSFLVFWMISVTSSELKPPASMTMLSWAIFGASATGTLSNCMRTELSGSRLDYVKPLGTQCCLHQNALDELMH